MPDYPLEIIVLVFIFGLCIGSFMNVCIYRIPLSRSIVSPPSSCPNCSYQIRFYDNIPVLSYLFLRGKCRGCGIPISIRYPLVELLNGFFAVCVFLKFGFTLQTPVYYAFVAVLVLITFIDIDHQIIPDVISLPGIPLFMLGAMVIPSMSLKASLIGGLLGGGILMGVAKGYWLLTRREGMGGGDIKLLAMIGVLIGWQGVFFTVFTSSAAGTLAGLMVMAWTRNRDMKIAIPYGPFLALGAILYIFFGPALIHWYMTLVRP